jgi:DNA polymerase III epsilon subunit-like protein
LEADLSGLRQIAQFMERWIALDLETTGLSPTRHEIREIAAVPFGIDSDPLDRLPCFTRADFQRSSPQKARAALVELLEIVGEGSALVAHNAAFDLAFLAETLRRARVRSFALRAYCTLRLARTQLPDVPRYDLGSLRELLQLPRSNAHVALADARTVAALFRALARRAQIVDEQTVSALHGPPLQVRYRSGVTSERQ